MFRDIPELKAPKGKFRIVGIDKFEMPRDDAHWVVGDYDSKDEALQRARGMSQNESKHSTDPSIATVYYVYDENGSYLGGDIYKEE